jgi:hypothetical protein
MSEPTQSQRAANRRRTGRSNPLQVGTIAPTCHFDEAAKAIIVVLELKQMTAITNRASNPGDQSAAARWGRRLLKEMGARYRECCRTQGACELRIIRRRYDGEPV